MLYAPSITFSPDGFFSSGGNTVKVPQSNLRYTMVSFLESGNNTSIANAAVSIAEIERRSGFKFFQNLNPEIADKVKAQNDYDAWLSKF